MKRVYILVEDETGAEFLRRLLPPEVVRDAEIVPTGSSSEIPSLARSLLVRRRRPVAVLMDADSLSERVIQERKDSTEDLIQSAAASIPVKVIVVVPEIEAWFFVVPEAINRIFGQEMPQDPSCSAGGTRRGCSTNSNNAASRNGTPGRLFVSWTPRRSRSCGTCPK